MSSHRKGVVLVLIGVAFILPDATLIRMIDAPSLTVGVWRGLLMFVSITAVLAVRYRRGLGEAFRRPGRALVVSGLLSALGTTLFVTAVDRTSIANALVLLSTSPLIAALLTRGFLGERVPTRTWAAMVAALIGIVIVFAGSLETGVRSGDVLALLGALCWASNLTLVRHRRDVDMLPATATGGLMLGVGLLLLGTSPLEIEQSDIAPLLIDSVIVLPGAMGFITAGARRISSPEAGLILLLETVLGPILAAVVVDEAIASASWIGGAVVVGALAMNQWLALGEDEPLAPLTTIESPT